MASSPVSAPRSKSGYMEELLPLASYVVLIEVAASSLLMEDTPTSEELL